MNGVFADTAYWIALTNVQDVMYGIGPILRVDLEGGDAAHLSRRFDRVP